MPHMHTYHGIVHLKTLIVRRRRTTRDLLHLARSSVKREKKNNNTGAPPHLDTVSELRFGSGEDLLS
jgi:hypothetical protein